jgi:regulator of sirC expression with transglutaminase-like and TPR domain
MKSQWDRAGGDFSRAVAIDPNYPAVYYNRGICYFQLGEEGKALLDMEVAARKGNQNAQKWLKERRKSW